MTTTGYQLADRRYYVVEEKNGLTVSIKQVMFGGGIYPAPVKEVSKEKWPEVLMMARYVKRLEMRHE